MAKNITVSSVNNIGINNNTYEYTFKQGGIEFDDDTYISVNQTIVPNSVANISSSLGNNQFAYGLLGVQFTLSTNGNITFTLNSNASNTSTLSVNIATGYLYTGYAIEITGVTTTTPILITSIALSDVNSATASITINQSITALSGTTGVGYIVGQNVVILCPTNSVPQVNASMSDLRWLSQYSVPAVKGANLYITSVTSQSDSNPNNIYLIKLNKEIPYDAKVKQYSSATTGTYIYTITLQNGYYDIYSLNKAIQQTLYNNGHYYYNLASGVSGTVNETIYYPFSIDYSLPYYSFIATQSTFPVTSNIVTTYGTGSLHNTNFLYNSTFDNILITNNTSTTLPTIWGWTQSNTLGEIGITRGTNSVVNVTPPSSVIQAIYLKTTNTTTSVSTITSNSFYLPTTANYTLTFNLFRKNAGVGDKVDITIDGYTVTVNPSTGWSVSTNSFITVGGTTATITISYTSTNASQPNYVAISNLVLTCDTATQKPIGVNWKGEYPNNTSARVIIYPNFLTSSSPITTVSSLNSSSALVSYSISNPYCLGNYLMSSLDPIESFTTSLRTTGLPKYGLNMNPFVGFTIKCNLAKNDVSSQTDIIDVFPLLYDFGSNNIYVGDAKNDIQLRKGKYNNIQFKLCDQFGTPIPLLDNNVLMVFKISKIYLHNFQK